MSKFQYQHTFISGALFSLWSIALMGSISVVTYLYVTANTTIVSVRVGATSSGLSFSIEYL